MVSQTHQSRFQKNMVSIALIYGVIAGLVAILWAALFLSQLNINAMPLGGMSWQETVVVFAFVVSGPLVSLMAGIIALKRPSFAALLFLIGGTISTGLAIVMISSDSQSFPLLLVTASMLGIGYLLRRSTL